MKNKNACFQVNVKDDGTYIKLIAPSGEGTPLLYKELNAYFAKHNIHNYDVVELGKALLNQSSDKDVKILNDNTISIDESMSIEVIDNEMTAVARFYAPSNNGGMLTKSDINRILKQEKITYGIDEDIIDEFISKREYCTNYIIAKGTPMKQGSNAYINYHFNIDLTSKPATNEDGSVDFHKLDIISHCEKGDLLATLVPEVKGVTGYNVYGKAIAAATVKRKYLKKGKNLMISEDGLKMYAETAGHVILENEDVKVLNVYEVNGSVDNSTGDIDYNGDILIKGNVLTGFKVKATGNIDIDGVVEGALIEAGGHVILKRGIQGMNKGNINAAGNVIAKFIENSKVNCGGYLSTDSIMHSDISADGEVIVSGRRGFVSGGTIRSGNSISVKTVGSMMGTMTVLEVGISPGILDDYEKVDRELSVSYENKEKILNALNQLRKKITDTGQASPETKQYIKQLLDNHGIIDKQIKEATAKANSMKKVMEDSTGVIEIQGIAYPGTTAIIANVYYLVRDKLQYCRLVREGAEIKVRPL